MGQQGSSAAVRIMAMIEKYFLGLCGIGQVLFIYWNCSYVSQRNSSHSSDQYQTVIGTKEAVSNLIASTQVLFVLGNLLI